MLPVHALREATMQRRDFLKRSAIAGAALPLASSGLLAHPFGHSFFARPASIGDRVLVLINLNGGNDGLNTVVPFNDPVYFNSRKTIGLKQTDLIKITDDLALNNAMSQTAALFQDGRCAIVENVGYPEQDRSHFRSTDIWNSASQADQVLFTGWLGRYLEKIHPEYPSVLPHAPFAIQVSASTSLALQSDKGSMGIAIDNPDRFYSLAYGLKAEEDPVPATLAGPELQFVRDVIDQSNFYSTEINKAMLNGSTNAQYDGDSLSAQLKVVARLINGGLQTGVFMVSLPGFDTHFNQVPLQAQRLTQVSRSVKNFLDDVAAAGNGDRVVAMTYSEFGRRLNENGSAGTDHGAAAPQFVFGNPVRGGRVLGGLPNLTDLDDRGDVKFTVDFRSLYGTVLQDWMGFSSQDTTTALGGDFAKLDLFTTSAPSSVRTEADAARAGYRLAEATPNPASTRALLSFDLPEHTRVRLYLVGSRGAIARSIMDRSVDAGHQSMMVDVADLTPGSYLTVLEAGGYRLSRKLSIVR